jgi:predicted phosphodiesterase
MRIAILADVHANLPAVEAVLEDISQQHVDRVVVNGDSVNRGPESVAVMRTLQQVKHDAVLGNHDDVMLMIDERRDVDIDPWYLDPFWLSARLAAKQVEQAGYLDAIRAMPMTLRIEQPGAPSLLISHGSPRHYREGIGPRTTPEVISEITEEHPADVLVGSHTHRPYLASWGRYTVMNTGSVGAPFTGDPRAHYLILTLAGGRWVPEFRRLPYDRQRALDAYERSGMLAQGGLSAAIFREELRHARSFMVPFLMWCEEEKLDRNEEMWREYRRMRASRFVLPSEADGVRSSEEP